ncbi:MAG: hypothetical protein A3C50_02510 [Candidatus Staskawiczbacteria bacterium RIFCSPHIGHO2_02_FULL_43_16]|uniref:Uncharacterized protein n=1 Tax=Candidatus Staskawiczbacteria bacterium RIFCSPHIGHO2_01_FULL_41_41 TaxID=1802203 RepID=A0A1G2HV41_9BACT|nr:MAG: hypothetical protein A2822_01575 [Candidatus Staskawiczbacteria bacterium RIFCSPHIGHO2_01_FULL_41_41]OGZ68159.1 MAG: hypothetical protein A3C50_02510 [Candidatus Staskawiczbacteria bacterium RIFCSPHIGHO2_02_FULL_43_16]OGZ74949.1 MAG: hypothetical protein A3A12_03905 [Candidatus Staskawiczbacteria bacterium RIFCSPLOWO2_01_FULL_43_17b]
MPYWFRICYTRDVDTGDLYAAEPVIRKAKTQRRFEALLVGPGESGLSHREEEEQDPVSYSPTFGPYATQDEAETEAEKEVDIALNKH